MLTSLPFDLILAHLADELIKTLRIQLLTHRADARLPGLHWNGKAKYAQALTAERELGC